MVNWWNGLNLLQQVFTCFAIPATLVLIIQIILFIIGLSGGDGDTDVSHGEIDGDGLDLGDSADGDTAGISEAADVDDSAIIYDSAEVKLLTLRSIVAFFAVGGWTGVVLGGMNLSLPAVVILSIMAGWAALYFVTWSIRIALRLQHIGNIQVSNAIGKVGEVYITVPAENKGRGKVNVVVQERFFEFEATTSAERDLKTGESVFVTGITEDNALIVIPNDEINAR
ncbi:MAG: hypothetical protein GX027_03060 [Clostridiaceae bacterium]|jgi:hypothetical protein|nr:hypothetical protein [Clostridiaceae bacterium]